MSITRELISYLLMQLLKNSIQHLKAKLSIFESAADQWLMANPIALFKALRMRRNQRYEYDHKYRRRYNLRKKWVMQ